MKRFGLFLLVFAAAGFGVSIALNAADVADGNAYASAKKCMKCHFKQYSEWKKTDKAKAYEAIENEPDKELCYPCHTTGYGRPGGFVDAETTPDLKGVGCGSCHGPGEKHIELATAAKAAGGDIPAEVKAAIMLTPTTCAECHNPHVKDKAAHVREANK